MYIDSPVKMEVILYVKDMAAEVHFYRDVLGLSISYPVNLEDYAQEMWVEFACGDGVLALHGGGSETPDDSHEVVFWVEDVARTRERIIGEGIVMGEVRTLEDGHPIAEGVDPGGHRFAIRS